MKYMYGVYFVTFNAYKLINVLFNVHLEDKIREQLDVKTKKN